MISSPRSNVVLFPMGGEAAPNKYLVSQDCYSLQFFEKLLGIELLVAEDRLEILAFSHGCRNPTRVVIK